MKVFTTPYNQIEAGAVVNIATSVSSTGISVGELVDSGSADLNQMAQSQITTYGANLRGSLEALANKGYISL